MVNGRTIAEDMERECYLSSLRDTFAAAALTGLIANGDYSVESTPILACRMADAMLRERERNGAPGWCETVQSDDIAETAAFCECGSPLVVSRFKQICDDEAHYQGDVATVIPLYRSPTLTEAEREALQLAVKMAGDPSPITAPQVFEYAATLRGLLERMK